MFGYGSGDHPMFRRGWELGSLRLAKCPRWSHGQGPIGVLLENAAFRFRVNTLREKDAAPAPKSRPRENLAQFLLESPLAGSDLSLEQQQDYGRPIDL
jgi:hypothetical protein